MSKLTTHLLHAAINHFRNSAQGSLLVLVLSKMNVICMTNAGEVGKLWSLDDSPLRSADAAILFQHWKYICASIGVESAGSFYKWQH